MKRLKRAGAANWGLALVILGSLGIGGCATVVGAGAGAVGAVAYTDRGAKANVKGDVAEVTRNAQSVFKEMGIQTTSSSLKESGKEQELKGKSSTAQVDINIKSTGKDVSSVEVVAQKGTLDWDKDYAKEVLSKIVSKS